ncbi:MAG TPA: peptidase M22 [Opitutaceae bacterium]|jgi:tRNA threonylcarbamoyladenosine biosynthesis protein TsaB|nr:peptidase M22 [Opitutaceae bacterium]
MPSLRELITTHAPLLLLDAASTRVQVALFGSNGVARWAVADDEAGVALFRGVESLGVDLAQVRAFAFCEGPGSILGIRTAAMALRTWNMLTPRPVFAFRSLEIVAHDLARRESLENFSIIADARRGAWHCVEVHAGATGPLRRVNATELAGALFMPENFRTWAALPAETRTTGYDLATLLPRVAEAELFRATEAPDAFLHEDPSYQTWTPRIHSATTTP